MTSWYRKQNSVEVFVTNLSALLETWHNGQYKLQDPFSELLALYITEGLV